MVVKGWLSEVRLKWFPAFWVVCFAFFFYTASFIYFISISFLIGMDMELNRILATLLRTLSGLMYSVMGLAYFLPYLHEKLFLAQEKH